MKYFFILCLLLTLATGAYMKLHEHRFDVDGSFNIMKFEFPENRDSLADRIQIWSVEPKKTWIKTQLGVDYIFMSVLFPGLLALLFVIRSGYKNLALNYAKDEIFINNPDYQAYVRRLPSIVRILKWAALFQIIAWLFDFCENVRLEKWIDQGTVGNMFLFKSMVVVKFLIGIIGVLLALFFYFKLRRHRKKLEAIAQPS